MRRLDVCWDGRIVGMLTQDRFGELGFAYSLVWLDDVNALPLSALMSRRLSRGSCGIELSSLSNAMTGQFTIMDMCVGSIKRISARRSGFRRRLSMPARAGRPSRIALSFSAVSLRGPLSMFYNFSMR